MNARPYWLLPLLMLIVIAATIACGFALTLDGPANFDVPLLMWFRDTNNTAQLAGLPWMTQFWLSITWLGNTTPRLVVAGLAILGLVLLRRWCSALFVTGVLVSGIVLSTLIKGWVGRPRPQLVAHLDQVSSMSFPSGHALNSTLFYLTITLIIAPLLTHRTAHWFLYCLTISSSLAIGISRVALGVHWPSDVLASWVIAYSWLGLWVILAKHYWPKALT